jgi:hypothetical protein
MFRCNDVARVSYSTNGTNGDAEETKDTGDHVNGLVASEYTVWTEFGVRTGYLTGSHDTEEIDEEEIPL